MTGGDRTGRKTVLVVEDDEDIRDLIVEQLARDNYRLLAAPDIAGLRRICAAEAVDLIVLDLNLPDGDGLALCRELRARDIATPVIMVTARGTAIDRVLGLELGADDYLTKPFEPRELMARVRNLLRRTEGNAAAAKVQRRLVRFGPWRLDLFQRRLIAPDEGRRRDRQARLRCVRGRRRRLTGGPFLSGTSGGGERRAFSGRQIERLREQPDGFQMGPGFGSALQIAHGPGTHPGAFRQRLL